MRRGEKGTVKKNYKRAKSSWSKPAFNAQAMYSPMVITPESVGAIPLKANSVEDLLGKCIGVKTANMKFMSWGWARPSKVGNGIILAKINPVTGIAKYKTNPQGENNTLIIGEEKLSTAKFFLHPRNNVQQTRSFGSHQKFFQSKSYQRPQAQYGYYQEDAR